MLSIAAILVAGLLLSWPAAAHQTTTPAGVTVDYWANVAGDRDELLQQDGLRAG